MNQKSHTIKLINQQFLEKNRGKWGSAKSVIKSLIQLDLILMEQRINYYQLE